MTRLEFENILAFGAFTNTGHIDEVEFSIMQGEAFADSKNNVTYAKYLAFLPDDDAPVQTYCNTVDELLQTFIIDGKPFGELLDKVTDFAPVAYGF
jgi:hypothetical protein